MLMHILNLWMVLLKRGINIPIIPGILPVTNCKRTVGICKKMNCEMPLDLIEMFKGLDQIKKLEN